MKTTIKFSATDKNDWGDLQQQCVEAINRFMDGARKENGKSFEVCYKQIDDFKTNPQIRTIYRLATLLALRLTEVNGINYSLENAKDFIKYNADFLRPATESECLAEAMQIKNKMLANGDKMTQKQFLELVKSLKQTLRKPNSFALATKEEMQKIIDWVLELANKMSWGEIKITSKEERDLFEYFNQK